MSDTKVNSEMIQDSGKVSSTQIQPNSVSSDDISNASIVDTDISVSSSEVELVEEQKTDSQNATDRRRRREYRSGNSDKSVPNLADSGEFTIRVPEHSPPLPLPLPTIGTNTRVSCQSCNAIFEIESGLKKFSCPVCGEKIKLG